MATSSKPELIRFLNKHDILWMPIADMKLDPKGKKIFDPHANKDLLGYVPSFTDFKNIEATEIKKRQKKYTKSGTIAIDTNNIAIIDCDAPDIPDEVKVYLKTAPYFNSYTKNLPKIFVRLENLVNTKNTKTKFGEAVEIQTGQWSYAKLDSRVENFSQSIPLINVSEWIIAKDKKYDTIQKLLLKLDDSRCEDRSKWWAVGMSIKKELGDKGWDLFDEWSKNCNEKYDSDKNREIWDSMEIKDNMNINVLKKWIKDDATKECGDSEKYDSSDRGIALLFVSYFPNILSTNKTIYKFAHNRWSEISCTTLKKIVSNDLFNIISKQLAETYDDLEKKNYFMQILFSLKTNKFFKDAYDQILIHINDDDAFDKFDENPNLIGFNNGVYDMLSGVFRDGKPDDYITLTTGYEYLTIDESKMKMWNDLLADIFPDPDVRIYYKQVMASSLCGNRKFEQVYMHTGSGGNGKGLLTDLMEKVFGNYYAVMNSNLLTVASKSRNEASPELANKKGKRVAITTEIEEGSTLQMAAIKQWSGGDKISTRALYKDAFEFVPQFTLHMYFNDKQPDLKSVDNAIKRRLRMFHYPISFVDNPILPHEKKGNPHLKSEFKEDCEIWNVVAHDLLNVWKDVSTMDFIQAPAECQKHINKYLSENDTIQTWFAENVEKHDGSKIKARDLYNEYVKWIGTDPKKLTETAFGKVMIDRFKLEKIKTKVANVYENIRLKCDADSDSDSGGETEDI